MASSRCHDCHYFTHTRAQTHVHARACTHFSFPFVAAVILRQDLPLDQEEDQLPQLNESASLTPIGAVSSIINLMGGSQATHKMHMPMKSKQSVIGSSLPPHARTHTRMHTRTHAHTRMHAHTHTHAYTHTHTHTHGCLRLRRLLLFLLAQLSLKANGALMRWTLGPCCGRQIEQPSERCATLRVPVGVQAEELSLLVPVSLMILFGSCSCSSMHTMQLVLMTGVTCFAADAYDGGRCLRSLVDSMSRTT